MASPEMLTIERPAESEPGQSNPEASQLGALQAAMTELPAYMQQGRRIEITKGDTGITDSVVVEPSALPAAAEPVTTSSALPPIPAPSIVAPHAPTVALELSGTATPPPERLVDESVTPLVSPPSPLVAEEPRGPLQPPTEREKQPDREQPVLEQFRTAAEAIRQSLIGAGKEYATIEISLIDSGKDAGFRVLANGKEKISTKQLGEAGRQALLQLKTELEQQDRAERPMRERLQREGLLLPGNPVARWMTRGLRYLNDRFGGLLAPPVPKAPIGLAETAPVSAQPERAADRFNPEAVPEGLRSQVERDKALALFEQTKDRLRAVVAKTDFLLARKAEPDSMLQRYQAIVRMEEDAQRLVADAGLQNREWVAQLEFRIFQRSMAELGRLDQDYDRLIETLEGKIREREDRIEKIKEGLARSQGKSYVAGTRRSDPTLASYLGKRSPIRQEMAGLRVQLEQLSWEQGTRVGPRLAETQAHLTQPPLAEPVASPSQSEPARAPAASPTAVPSATTANSAVVIGSAAASQESVPAAA